MTITVGTIGPQRGPCINHLLILMSAIRVKSGTRSVRNAAPCRLSVHATALTKCCAAEAKYPKIAGARAISVFGKPLMATAWHIVQYPMR
jgi:hypothetical protein